MVKKNSLLGIKEVVADMQANGAEKAIFVIHTFSGEVCDRLEQIRSSIKTQMSTFSLNAGLKLEEMFEMFKEEAKGKYTVYFHFEGLFEKMQTKCSESKLRKKFRELLTSPSFCGVSGKEEEEKK